MFPYYRDEEIYGRELYVIPQEVDNDLETPPMDVKW